MARLAAQARQPVSRSYDPSWYSGGGSGLVGSTNHWAGAGIGALFGSIGGSTFGFLVWGTSAILAALTPLSIDAVWTALLAGVLLGACLAFALAVSEGSGDAFAVGLVVCTIVLGVVAASIAWVHSLFGTWYGWPLGGAIVCTPLCTLFGGAVGD